MLDLTTMTGLREGNRLEAKEAAGGIPKSTWETYSAFANTNGGVILLGVSEDRAHHLTATGVHDPERMAKNIWDTLNNRNKISANVLDEEDLSIEQVGNVSIIVIRVPRANRESKPVYIDRNPLGGTYRRNGEGDYRCSEEEYRAMIRDNGTGATTLDNLPLERFDPTDLDDDTIGAYRNSLSAVRPGHPWLALDTNEFLLRLGATAKGDDQRIHPTRAGLLMFGHEWKITQEFPYYFLDYREVGSGIRRWEHRMVSGDGEWSGNLYGFWLKVWPRLTQAATRPFALDTHMRRVDDTPLHMTLREALANTIIHADYYVRGNTVITVGQDHVEFANPGGLRIPADVAMAGGLSDSRNPTLLKMFSLISIVERAGSGFDAMRAGCAWAGVPAPKLTETFDPDRTHLSFDLTALTSRASASDNGSEQVTTAFAGNPPINPETTDPETTILEYLSDHTSITRATAQELTGMSASTTKTSLKRLMEQGKVLRQGNGRGTYYTRASGTPDNSTPGEQA